MSRPLVSASTVWKLTQLIRLCDQEDLAGVRRELVRLTGYEESETRALPTLVTPPEGRAVLGPAGEQPKPQGRIIDEPLLARFRARHPVCWIIGCGRPSGPAHHLRKRSDHGNDEESNLFSLCDFHHVFSALSFHELRPYGGAFYVVYSKHLELDHKARLVAALPEIEEQVPGILNRSITVYPAEARALIAA